MADKIIPVADLGIVTAGSSDHLIIEQNGNARRASISEVAGVTESELNGRLNMPEYYGAVGDGIADDTAEVNASVAAANGDVLLTGDYLLTGAPTNPLGVEFDGEGRLLQEVTGGQRQLNTQVDEGQHVFGREYLYAHLNALRTTRQSKIVVSGDSTTENTHIAAPKFRITNLLQAEGLRRGFDPTVINAGHSGNHTGQWLSTWLTGDIAQAPKLYVVRWGVNDPFYGRSLTQFATDLRAGLAQFRAAYNVAQGSILLCTPVSTYDVPNGRDAKWYEKVRKIIRRAARDYQCCFVDVYGLFQDSTWTAGNAYDNPFGDGRPIHPMETANMQIASVLADVMYPPGFNFNMIAASEHTVTSANLPSSYPMGWSVYYGPAEAAGTGWGNINTIVQTWRSPDGRVTQRIVAASFSGTNTDYASVLFERDGAINLAAGLDGWNRWRTKRWEDATPLLANGWTAFSGSPPYMKINNNVITLGGLVNSGTTADGTVILTLPVGFRPRNNPEIFLCQSGSTATVSAAMVRVTNDGNVTLLKGGVSGFLSLSGITFEAGI